MSISDQGIASSGAASGTPGRDAGEQRRMLADAARRLIEATVTAELPDEAVAAAAERVAAVADELAEASGGRVRIREVPDPAGPAERYFPTSPAVGSENPVAAPVRLHAEGGTLTGTVTFGAVYEGPPGCVHGGVIALLFDELLGAVNIAAGHPGMTGTLTIRYRKPTPLHAPLTLESRCHGQEGRKIRTTGTIRHGDVVTAEAEGVFIQVLPAQFLARIAESGGEEAVAALREQGRHLEWRPGGGVGSGPAG